MTSGAALCGDRIVFRRDGVETVLLYSRRHRLARRAQRGKRSGGGFGCVSGWAPTRPRSPQGVRTFPGVEHRLEFVAEIGGVKFFNDSKATNVDATLKALDAFPGGLFVILGGKDKGSDYALWPSRCGGARGRSCLIGAAAEKIEAQIGGAVPL